jgi:hypothetical protein
VCAQTADVLSVLAVPTDEWEEMPRDDQERAKETGYGCQPYRVTLPVLYTPPHGEEGKASEPSLFCLLFRCAQRQTSALCVQLTPDLPTWGEEMTQVQRPALYAGTLTRVELGEHDRTTVDAWAAARKQGLTRFCGDKVYTMTREELLRPTRKRVRTQSPPRQPQTPQHPTTQVRRPLVSMSPSPGLQHRSCSWTPVPGPSLGAEGPQWWETERAELLSRLRRAKEDVEIVRKDCEDERKRRKKAEAALDRAEAERLRGGTSTTGCPVCKVVRQELLDSKELVKDLLQTSGAIPVPRIPHAAWQRPSTSSAKPPASPARQEKSSSSAKPPARPPTARSDKPPPRKKVKKDKGRTKKKTKKREEFDEFMTTSSSSDTEKDSEDSDA